VVRWSRLLKWHWGCPAVAGIPLEKRLLQLQPQVHVELMQRHAGLTAHMEVFRVNWAGLSFE